MRLFSLLLASVSLVVLTTLGVCGVPTDAAVHTQAVTIQRFPLKDDYGHTNTALVQKLTDAMRKFKSSSGKKIKQSYLGVLPGNPDIVEQIFLWKDQADSSDDLTKPFERFSESGARDFNRSTAVIGDRSALLDALNSPATEVILGDIRPEIPTSDLERDISTVITDSHDKGFAVAEAHGINVVGGRRTLIVIIGWKSEQAMNDWKASLDAKTAAVVRRLGGSLIDGAVPPTVKHIFQVI